MKRLGITAALIAAFAVLGAGRANAQATTTLDFNDGVDLNPMTTFYSALGVTFSNAMWYDFAFDNEATVGASGLKLLSESDGFLPVVTNPIVALFSQAISAASIAALDIGADGATLVAYDATTGGNVVASSTIFGTDIGLGNNQIMSVSGSGIRRIEMYRPLDVIGEGLAFDNLSFTTQVTATPEPASFVLCATGLAGLAGWTRRRRKHRAAAA